MFTEGWFVLFFSAAMVVAVLIPRIQRSFDRHLHNGRRIRNAMLVAYSTLFLVSAYHIVATTAHHQNVGGWQHHEGLLAVVLAANMWFVATARIKPHVSISQRRILAIGAHPDDLELACGGTLARLADLGHEVHSMVMSRGGVGGQAERRAREAVRGSRYLGAGTIEVHDFPDTNMALASQQMTRVIEEAIAWLKPDIVMTHSAHDHHQDHLAVHLATMRAARGHPSILCFESPSATREFQPAVYFSIDHYVQIKKQAIAMHRDQVSLGKSYMSENRVEGTAAFRGGQVKRARAEGFEVIRLLADEAGIV